MFQDKRYCSCVIFKWREISARITRDKNNLGLKSCIENRDDQQKNAVIQKIDNSAADLLFNFLKGKNKRSKPELGHKIVSYSGIYGKSTGDNDRVILQ